MVIDTEILRGLLHDPEYSTKVLPYIEQDYFQSQSDKHLCKFIKDYTVEFRSVPSVEALAVMIDDANLNEHAHEECIEQLQDIKDAPDKKQTEWLFKRTEQWAQDRALHNALTESIHIFKKTETKDDLQRTAIPDLLKDALSIEFTTDVGMGYFEDMQRQYEYYQHSEDPENKLRFDIDILNEITRGGIPRKTANLVFAGVNVGKTAFLCYLAGMYLQAGHNVLFISCEMQEELIRERIDANILGLPTEKFYKIKEDLYLRRLEKIKEKTPSELYIRAYAPLRSNSITYENLIKELDLKKNFKPDVVLIDYLGIVASSTLPVSAMQNSNLYLGQVSKELRALAVENNFVLWSAHQLNREGMKEIEVEMTHSGGSIDITKDVDFIASISQPEEFEKRNQALFKQLKNRYNKKSRLRRFIMGMDTDLMRFYQVEDSVQEQLNEHRQQAASTRSSPKQEKEEFVTPDSTRRRRETSQADVSDWKM